MTENESDDELIDDYISEYETCSDHFSRPIRSSNLNGVTYTDIFSTGVEFEVNENESEDSENENYINSTPYRTREDIASHLDDNPMPDNKNCTFGERIARMHPIVKDGVYKRVIRQGFGKVITRDSAVMYHLNAFLDGQDQPFDSSWLRGRPYLHRLDYDKVVEGLCAGLLTMRRGERSQLIVRPEYAYLEMGCPPRVPENATILYIVEVLCIFKEGTLQHYETLSFEDRNQTPFIDIYYLCDNERISGNIYFEKEFYSEAAVTYRRAIRNLEYLTYKSESDEKRGKQLLLKLYVNIANTYNKIERPHNAISHCKRALEIDEKCVKALYHYGVANLNERRYKESRDALSEANRLKPYDRSITDALTELDRRMADERLGEEELYKRMASGFNR